MDRAAPGRAERLITVDAAERRQRLADIAAWLGRCGAPAAELARLEAEIGELEAALTNIEPDVELTDGMPVPGTDGGCALHTPGHTPGHLCFHDRDRDLLLTGDHVSRGSRRTSGRGRDPTSTRCTTSSARCGCSATAHPRRSCCRATSGRSTAFPTGSPRSKAITTPG